MYGTWWRTLWVSIYMVILVVNIAFTFNVVNLVNPSSLDLDYSSYYFGFSSFIDSFDWWFGHNDFLNGFYDLLLKIGNAISKIFNFYKNLADTVIKLTGWRPKVTEIIAGVIALVTFALNAIPLLLMLILGCLYFLYLAMFGLQIILFVISFFGGTFATPLPNVYPELNTPIDSLRAIMV